MLSPEEEKQVLSAIQRAENGTSAEVKVHLEKYCEGDALSRTIEVFELLELYKTEQRNGVLIYIAWHDHKAAIWGDQGIHGHLGQAYWENILSDMMGAFVKGAYAQGLMDAIAAIGEKLKKHFPVRRDDQNELSNDISYGDR